MADVRRVEEGLVRNEEVRDEKDDKISGAEHQSKDVEAKPKSNRIATLDAFIGLTIVLMILVDDAGGVYARIDHSPWNGCYTLADFVMPFFLLIVGVTIALAFKRVPNQQDAAKKIVIRTLKLLFWGIILQGGYSHAPDDLAYGVDMKHIRWCGILQRIALVYLIVALIEALTVKMRPTVLGSGYFTIFTAYRWQWFGGFMAFIIYMITTFALYVPDWNYTYYAHDGSKKFGMAVDRQVWGVNHLYTQPVWIRLKACTLSYPEFGSFRDDAPSFCLGPFEPEGLLSSISATVSATIGVHYGHVLIHFKAETMALVLIVVAIILHFTDAIPLNKQLHSFSYVCFTAGVMGIVFSGFYILVNILKQLDFSNVWGFRTPFLFLEWIGMNAMLFFVLGAQGILAAFIYGWYYRTPAKSLVHWIERHAFINVWNSQKVERCYT
ncbi:hypothetical protein MKX01_027379 [Papaver californicum]|nr:hypothetical protein MKX01_027379 [Papaver californicum]